MHHHKTLIPSILTNLYQLPIQSAISLNHSSQHHSDIHPSILPHCGHTSILPVIPLQYFTSIVKPLSSQSYPYSVLLSSSFLPFSTLPSISLTSNQDLLYKQSYPSCILLPASPTPSSAFTQLCPQPYSHQVSPQPNPVSTHPVLPRSILNQSYLHPTQSTVQSLHPPPHQGRLRKWNS